ncbi:MAG: hypothetical protein J6R36_00965 [Bacteroidaceae bacterium]|jgi:hypothetical protein|nr:hypothetical protein [Bacteroidaceae bacterium]
MSYYDNPYSDDAYERYMHTGELAEYFESYSEEEVVEEVVEEEVECDDLNKQLDDVIRSLKQQIKEKERILKAQKKAAKTR